MLGEREAEEASPSPAGTLDDGQVGASGEDRPGRAAAPGRGEGWLLPQGSTATPSAAPPSLINTRTDGHDHLITCSAGEPGACVSICCRSPCCRAQPLSFLCKAPSEPVSHPCPVCPGLSSVSGSWSLSSAPSPYLSVSVTCLCDSICSCLLPLSLYPPLQLCPSGLCLPILYSPLSPGFLLSSVPRLSVSVSPFLSQCLFHCVSI